MKEIKNWDSITIILLIVSVLTVIFSFIAPIIFTEYQCNSRYDFTNTGAIGDTIGGLMNPFIALAGIILTFMAFYMQIKANQIQILQFKQGIKEEKEKDIRNEKIDCYNKISLLKYDIQSIVKDIFSKAENIKTYYEKEKSNSFDTNILLRSPSKEYTRILETDRLSIYKGFQFFVTEKDWLKSFSNLYNILDFLPDFFKNIYDIYENHSNDIFRQKMEVRNDLIEFMNINSQMINAYKAEKQNIDYLNYPASKLCNETLFKYYEIVEQSFDENKRPIKETDFHRIDIDVLKYFLDISIKYRNEQNDFDRRLEPIIEFVSNIRRKIVLIKNRMIEVSDNIENEYFKLMIDNKKEKSFKTSLEEIGEVLEEELLKINIEKI
jgi:hypothetical protein